jgi:hypothetical protein
MSKRKIDLPLPGIPEPGNEFQHYLKYLSEVYEFKKKQNDFNFKRSIDKLESENCDLKKKLDVMEKSQENMEKANEEQLHAIKIKYSNIESVKEKLIKNLEDQIESLKQQYTIGTLGYQEEIDSIKKDLEEKTNAEKNTKEVIAKLEAKIKLMEVEAKTLEDEAKVNFKRQHEQAAEDYKKEITEMSENLIQMANSRMEKARKLF